MTSPANDPSFKADDLSDQQAYDVVSFQIEQMRNLAVGLQLFLEQETQQPLRGDIPGSMAIALEHAAEHTQSLFEAYFHPVSTGTGSECSRVNAVAAD